MKKYDEEKLRKLLVEEKGFNEDRITSSINKLKVNIFPEKDSNF